jgi:hypothetical protein
MDAEGKSLNIKRYQWQIRRIEESAQNSFREIIQMLRNKKRVLFCIVLYPKFALIIQSYSRNP